MSIISHLNKFNKANNTQHANKTEKINNDNKKNKDVNYAQMLGPEDLESHDAASYGIKMVDEQEQKYFNDKINDLTKTKEEIEKKLEDMPNSGFNKLIRTMLNKQLESINKQIDHFQQAKSDDNEKDKYVKSLESKKAAYVEFQKKNPIFAHVYDDQIKKLDEELAIFKK